MLLEFAQIEQQKVVTVIFMQDGTLSETSLQCATDF